MDCYAGKFLWKDASKDDINNAKFLKLLLKYGYKWCQNNGEMRLNLTETNKSRFLKECSESIECLDEMKASITIELIRKQYNEELYRLQNGSIDAYQTKIPWFILACQLFYQSSTPEASPISSPSTPPVAIASNRYPSSVSTLKITDASTSAMASYLSPTPNVEPLSWTTRSPNRERPSFYQGEQLFPSVSPKNVYGNEFSTKNVEPQHNFPYPFCILPCASLGSSRQGSGFPCVQNKNESLSGNGKPVDVSTSFHPQTSDFSYLPSIDRISDRTSSYLSDSRHFQTTNHDRNSSQNATSINSFPCVQNKNESLSGNGKPVDVPTSFHPHTSDFSYLPSTDRISGRTSSYLSDSRHFQTTNHDRNSSQHSTSINSMETIATNFTANNSLTKECENFTDEFSSPVSFSSSTARTSTSPSPVFRDRLPAFRDILPASSGTRTEFPYGKFKFLTSPTARTKPSTLLPRRN